ncbi:hypothetical protein FXO37_04830 [Capsicum annuum]|nr:hypothetical protein FXO37_04830 [Capsicum annuum]
MSQPNPIHPKPITIAVPPPCDRDEGTNAPENTALIEFSNDGKGHVKEESGVSFNKDTKNDIRSVDRASKNSEDAPPFDQPTTHTSSPSFVQCTAHVSSSPTDLPTTRVSSPIAAISSSFTTSLSSSTIAPTNSTIAPNSFIVAPTNSHAALSESIVDSDVESIDRGVEIGSDMDKKLRGLREEKKKRKRRKRGERLVIPEHIKLETEKRDQILAMMNLSMNFIVKTYNPVHKCDLTNRNKLCNTKFLAIHFNERIKEQPDIRIFEFQLLIKKELDLHVGRTMRRRAKNKGLEIVVTKYLPILNIECVHGMFLQTSQKMLYVESMDVEGYPLSLCSGCSSPRKLESVNYISHWYNRETYINTYSFFIQPILNMKMWPQSHNISDMSPPVRKMSGRPGKNRKKEEGAPAAGTNTNPGLSSSAGTVPSAGPSAAPTVEKGRGSTGRGRGRPPKDSTEKCAGRPRMVGMGLLHTQSRCTILNQL